MKYLLVSNGMGENMNRRLKILIFSAVVIASCATSLLYVKEVKPFLDWKSKLFLRESRFYLIKHHTFLEAIKSNKTITENDVKILKDPTFNNLSKLAIETADATIIGSETINSELNSFIKDSGKPYLDYYNEESYIDAYSEFYDKILL